MDVAESIAIVIEKYPKALPTKVVRGFVIRSHRYGARLGEVRAHEDDAWESAALIVERESQPAEGEPKP